MSKPTTYKLVRFEPQELIDLGAVLYEVAGSRLYKKILEKEWGITEARLGELAAKLKRNIDRTN